MVIDVRSNGGGNVSQMILERLNRKLLATGMPRTDETTNTYPGTVFHGHLVCLLDEDSASDGDIFPAMFRESGLGPLIGKRSWGGVIGITNRGTLVDGGTVNVPEFGFASKDGAWIIEGTGVDPDIEVDNDPQSLMEGRDPQLERGIKEVAGEDPPRAAHLARPSGTSRADPHGHSLVLAVGPCFVPNLDPRLCRFEVDWRLGVRPQGGRRTAGAGKLLGSPGGQRGQRSGHGDTSTQRKQVGSDGMTQQTHLLAPRACISGSSERKHASPRCPVGLRDLRVKENRTASSAGG